jgi:hypothetical protein
MDVDAGLRAPRGTERRRTVTSRRERRLWRHLQRAGAGHELRRFLPVNNQTETPPKSATRMPSDRQPDSVSTEASPPERSATPSSSSSASRQDISSRTGSEARACGRSRWCARTSTISTSIRTKSHPASDGVVSSPSSRTSATPYPDGRASVTASDETPRGAQEDPRDI